MAASFLTAAEEHALALQAQAGDVSARNRIVLGIWRLIWREALKLANRYGHDPEDLAQVGVLKVLKEFAHFDPALNLRASSYFLTLASRAMQRFSQCEDQVIDVPAMSFVKSAPALSPAGEVAALNAAGRRAKAAYRALEIGTLETVLSSKFENNLGEPCTLGDIIEGHELSTPETASEHEEADRLEARIRLLPLELRLVIRMNLNEKSNKQIAAALRVSTQAVSNRLMRAVEMLRAMMHVEAR